MPRYINADAFENDILDRYCEPCKREHKDSKGPFCLVCGYKHMIESVRDAPTADVQEVKHGHWFKPSEMSENICSNCKKSTKTLFGVLSDYCPNCGAKMDEKEEIDDTDSKASV